MNEKSRNNLIVIFCALVVAAYAPPLPAMNQDNLPATFIPAWLDDLGLSANQFRIYCHLCRRRGKDGVAYPSGQSISKTCRISRKSFYGEDGIFATLEKRHLIKRADDQKRKFNTTTFQVLVVPNGIQLKESQLYPKGDTSCIPKGTRVVSQTPHKGNPLRESIKDRAFEYFYFPTELDSEAFKSAWQNWLAYRAERKLPAYKPIGQKAQLSRLSKIGTDRAVEAIIFSMAQNYHGIYEPKNNQTAKPQPPKVNEFEAAKNYGKLA